MMESLRSLEGKYEILDKIGEGGMGSVYKVRHRLLNEVRVIKTMRSHLINQEESRQRFFREARIAARARHENIAQIFDFAVDDDMAFLVMEYVDGVTLQDVLAQGEVLSLPLALDLAQQSLRALAFIHSIGIIHRDIAPDNLMVTTDAVGRPKIKMIDLGLAKLSEVESGLTREGFFLGKLRYASPEQFDSQGGVAVGSWSDVYSFGLVLYELVTGHFPIRGSDMAELMAGHVVRPPLPFSESDPEGHVPEDLRSIILRSLAKDAIERFSDGGAFRDQLMPIQQRYPCGDIEWSECLRLFRRPDEAPRPTKPASDQDVVNRVFGAEDSSGGEHLAERLSRPGSTMRPDAEVWQEGQDLETPTTRRSSQGAVPPPEGSPTGGRSAPTRAVRSIDAPANTVVRSRVGEGFANVEAGAAKRGAPPADSALRHPAAEPALPTQTPGPEIGDRKRVAAPGRSDAVRPPPGPLTAQELEARDGLAGAELVPHPHDAELPPQVSAVATPVEPPLPDRAARRPIQPLPDADGEGSDARPRSRLTPAAPPLAETVRAAPRPISPVVRGAKVPSLRWVVGLAAAGIALTALLLGLHWFRAISLPGLNSWQRPNPASTRAGTLVINALPWAEIVEVSDENGKPVSLDPRSYTPFVLSVAPGTYQIRLRNEHFGEQTLTATVAAGDSITRVVSLAEVTPDQLLRSLQLVP